MSVLAIKRRRHSMTAGAYHVVAAVIREIADPVIRKAMADHFGTEFNRRSPSFDPALWERATGGKVAPNSAHRTSKPKKEPPHAPPQPF